MPFGSASFFDPRFQITLGAPGKEEALWKHRDLAFFWALKKHDVVDVVFFQNSGPKMLWTIVPRLTTNDRQWLAGVVPELDGVLAAFAAGR